MTNVLTIAAILSLILSPTGAQANPPAADVSAVGVHPDLQSPGRGDDLARINAWRSFLGRADRAFFAAHMDTAAVRNKIAEADQRIEELQKAAESSEPDPGGRSDITGDVGFLERAQRAFTAAHMNTAEAQKWLREAREKDVQRAPDGSRTTPW